MNKLKLSGGCGLRDGDLCARRLNGNKLKVLLLSILLISAPAFNLSAETSNSASVSIQDDKTVVCSGTVVDDADLPLPGVNVAVKGHPTLGTTTDIDGKFTVKVPDDKAILVFTFIGMKTQEVRIQRTSKMVVRLEPDAIMMEEAVITGIYTRKAESFTGSVSTYRVDDLKMIGNQNVLQSFKTLDPALIFNENVLSGSNPNAQWDVNVRGNTSIVGLEQEYETDPNQPLFILDGFETTLQTISDLSMDRVQSITILKDAASTAIYGSKAANGVIVVETKRPEPGKLQFSYNGNMQIGWADLSDYNLMNSTDKLQFEKLAGYYGDLDENGEVIDEYNRSLYYERLKSAKQGLNTYWMNEPLRVAITHGHTLFAEGGDSAFRYGIGFSYKSTEGVMKGSDRDAINGNIRLMYRLNNLSFMNQTSIDYVDASNEIVSFSQFSRANPFYMKRNEDGEIEKILDTYSELGGDVNVYNPLWDFNQNSFKVNDALSFTNNFQVEWKIIEELRLRGKFGIVTGRSQNESFISPNSSSFTDTDPLKRGSYNRTDGINTSYDGSIDLTYGKVIKKHTINLIAGMQVTQSANQSYAWGVQGYITDQYFNPNFSSGYPEGGRPSSSISKARSASYYINGNYSYDNRYLLDLNYRMDGSSVYGVSNPFVGTWSFGLGWNIHNEKWFQTQDVMNYLKLRYSMGNPGNQNFDAKLASSVYNYSSTYQNPFGTAAIISRWGNNNLEWQRTLDMNAGIDMEFFDRRLRFNADYFIKRTDPMLLRISQPTSTGTSTVPMNIGATRNEGFTLVANYNIIRNQNLSWAINANLRNIRTTYYNIGDMLEKFNEEGRGNQTLTRYYDGASTTALWAVRSAGIDPMTGNEVFIKKDGSYTFEWDSADEVVVGDSTPTVEGILGTSLYWRGFSMNVNFRYRLGGQTMLSTLFNKVENISYASLHYNQDKRALYDRWQKPGDIAKYKRISSTELTNMSDRFIADENTLSCESISIGYETSTANWVKAIGASSFNIRLYANELFRFSTVKEERGIDYPFQRSISLSLGVRF